MRKLIICSLCLLLLSTISGCETANGITKDIANTARNVRDILGLGRDIERITK